MKFPLCHMSTSAVALRLGHTQAFSTKNSYNYFILWELVYHFTCMFSVEKGRVCQILQVQFVHTSELSTCARLSWGLILDLCLHCNILSANSESSSIPCFPVQYWIVGINNKDKLTTVQNVCILSSPFLNFWVYVWNSCQSKLQSL